MPLARMRFTIRGLMLAMAVAAVLLTAGRYGAEWWSRSRRARAAARVHATSERNACVNASLIDPGSPQKEQWSARAAYHARMARGWRRVARRPWDSNPPDLAPPTR